jgi:transcriptional regulator with XRE-family HTH domain
MTDRPTPPTLAAFICRVRRQAGLSQTELADLLGVRQTAVSQWERGVTEPYGGHLYALLVKLAPVSTTVLAASIAQHTLNTLT